MIDYFLIGSPLIFAQGGLILLLGSFRSCGKHSLLFFWCIQRVQAERAAIAAILEPVIASVLAWVWFGQTLTVMQIVGGFVIVVAITWMQFQTAKPASVSK